MMCKNLFPYVERKQKETSHAIELNLEYVSIGNSRANLRIKQIESRKLANLIKSKMANFIENSRICT